METRIIHTSILQKAAFALIDAVGARHWKGAESETGAALRHLQWARQTKEGCCRGRIKDNVPISLWTSRLVLGNMVLGSTLSCSTLS